MRVNEAPQVMLGDWGRLFASFNTLLRPLLKGDLHTVELGVYAGFLTTRAFTEVCSKPDRRDLVIDSFHQYFTASMREGIADSLDSIPPDLRPPGTILDWIWTTINSRYPEFSNTLLTCPPPGDPWVRVSALFLHYATSYLKVQPSQEALLAAIGITKSFSAITFLRYKSLFGDDLRSRLFRALGW